MTFEELDELEAKRKDKSAPRVVCDPCQELTTRPTYLGGTLIYVDSASGPRQIWVTEDGQYIPVEDMW